VGTISIRDHENEENAQSIARLANYLFLQSQYANRLEVTPVVSYGVQRLEMQHQDTIQTPMHPVLAVAEIPVGENLHHFLEPKK